MAESPSVNGQLPHLIAATPEFFEILGIEVVQGRRFTEDDDRARAGRRREPDDGADGVARGERARQVHPDRVRSVLRSVHRGRPARAADHRAVPRGRRRGARRPSAIGRAGRHRRSPDAVPTCPSRRSRRRRRRRRRVREFRDYCFERRVMSMTSSPPSAARSWTAAPTCRLSRCGLTRTCSSGRCARGASAPRCCLCFGVLALERGRHRTLCRLRACDRGAPARDGDPNRDRRPVQSGHGDDSERGGPRCSRRRGLWLCARRRGRTLAAVDARRHGAVRSDRARRRSTPDAARRRLATYFPARAASRADPTSLLRAE